MTAQSIAFASASADFSALTTPHLDRLSRLAMHLTREPSDSADLVQEALCRAWAAWSRFEKDSSIGPYLSRILYNAFVSKHRHKRVVEMAADRFDLVDHLFDRRRLDDAATPEAGWQRADLGDELASALEALPNHYRAAVELVDLEGLSYQEAATELGVPLGTVMSRLHRARRSMRRTLEPHARTFGYTRPEIGRAHV